MPKIILPNNGWKPRGYQKRVWRYLENGGKRAFCMWHRRAGKDDVCLHWAACAMHERVGTYWHMLPEASQARKAIWDAVNPHTSMRRIDEAFPLALRETTKENEMFIRFKNGSTWQVLGSDNYNSLVGSPPVGVVFSEWALSDPEAWAYIQPIFRENDGWALFITTPRGKNHAYNHFTSARGNEDWFCELLTAHDTKVFTQEQLDIERRELVGLHGYAQGMARFNQEYMCSFDAAIIGAYYGEQFTDIDADRRICSVPYNPAYEVHTAWDLGHNDATCIWFFQQVGQEIHLIDYHEENSRGLDYYAGVIKSKPYNYGKHFLPHDGNHHELGTGMTRAETLGQMGINTDVLPRCPNKIDLVTQGRMLLPFCWFDDTKTRRGVEALRQYRRKWNDKLKVFDDHPLHDWASNPADAFQYIAQAVNSGILRSPTKSSTIAPKQNLSWVM